MSKQTFKKSEAPSAPVRQDWEVNSVVQLFKRKADPPSAAKGIIIRPLKDDGKTVDYGAVGCVVWFKAIDLLVEGRRAEVSGYAVPPRELTSE